MDDLPFALERKLDGSLNKSAIIRAAYAHLLREGAVAADDPLPTRVHAVRAYLYDHGLAVLEDGCQHAYMLYAQAIKTLKQRRLMPMPTTAERIADLDAQISALVSRRNRLAAQHRDELIAAAKATIEGLVAEGLSADDIAGLMEQKQ